MSGAAVVLFYCLYINLLRGWQYVRLRLVCVLEGRDSRWDVLNFMDLDTC
jgi:hypothetical protein